MNPLPGRPRAGSWPFDDPELLSLDGPVDLQGLADGQKLLLYLMDSLACARCWHGLIALDQQAPWLRALGVRVVAVGPEAPHLRPAARLARRFGLALPLLVDERGDLLHLYQASGRDGSLLGTTLLLLDSSGSVRHCQQSRPPAAAVDMAALMEAATRVNLSPQLSQPCAQPAACC